MVVLALHELQQKYFDTIVHSLLLVGWCAWHSVSTQPRLLDHYYHIHILHVLSSVKNGLLLPVDRCVTCSLLLTPQMAVVARSLLAECSSVVQEPEGQGVGNASPSK